MGNTRTGAREADRARKREEGEKRNAAWAALTSTQKIAALNARLGKDVGARRQRKELSS